MPVRKAWGAVLLDSMARPAGSPVIVMLGAERVTLLLLPLPSLLPSSIWPMGLRVSGAVVVALLAAIVRLSRAIRSCRIRGDWGELIETVGAAIQAPDTTTSLWMELLTEVVPPSTKASAAFLLAVRLRVAADLPWGVASRMMFAACKVEL